MRCKSILAGIPGAAMVLVLGSSPVQAGMYRCASGSKTVYQDYPCPNARVVDNVNGRALTAEEERLARIRVNKERALAAQQSKKPSVITLTQQSIGHNRPLASDVRRR